MNTNIYFRNIAQVVLFECELKGQISDGQWENALPRAHYEKPTAAKVAVAVDDKQLGCDFRIARKYNFANKYLLEVVADRMLHWVRFTKAFPMYLQELDKHWDWDGDKITNPDALKLIASVNYSMQDLKRDLKDMSVIFNTMCSGVGKDNPKAVIPSKTMKDVKEKLTADSYSFMDGVYTARWGFYFTHGVRALDKEAEVRNAFADATVIESGEVWKPFRGGASVANQSHWYVKFTL